MASLLRQIVAGPRSRHPEAGLDLCYVTDEIIATSGPSSTYPQRAYRNPTDALVKFLDFKHKDKWAIWEFRAEGTGYPDEEVYGRILHYPWPDHHPPPFAIVPRIMGSMRNWLKGEKDRVVVVHCKAGKGRSGTMACSYLISECDWSISESLARFTERRMRAGFGQGVSIPSQLRWIEYVDRWAKHGKIYVERQVEILEVHVWGLRDGVKVAVEGYVNEGRHIKTFHIFKRDERMVLDDPNSSNQEIVNAAHFFNEKRKKPLKPVPSKTDPNITNSVSFASSTSQVNDPLPTRAATTAAYLEARLSPAISRVKDLNEEHTGSELGGGAVIFRPSEPLILPTSDINIDFERRNRAAYGWTMVTAVAHVWFNAFFEGQGPETSGKAADSGIFEIEWDKMDGVKGSARKGTRAFDRFAVVWKATGDDFEEGKERGITTRRRESIIREPKLGEEVEQLPAADWKGANAEQPDAMDRDLGLRVASPASADISKASSVRSAGSASTKLREQPSGSETPLPSGSKSETDEEENVKEDDVPAQDQLPRLQPNLTHPGPEQAKSGLDTADETTPIVDSVASTDMRGTQHGKGSTDPGNGQETLGRILEGVKSASTGDLPEEPKR